MASTRYELLSAFSLAWDSIIAHKLRSFLTLLGVIVGVASVIIVGAAIDGLGIYAEQSTAKAFGSESFLLAQIAGNGRLTRKEVFAKLKYNKRITADEDRYLNDVNADKVLYSPYRNQIADVKRDSVRCDETTIIGVSANMVEIRDITVVDGRFFTDQEDKSGEFVAVIGDDVKTILFPTLASPIGKTFKIQNLDFTVVGVQERLGSAFGRSQDKSAYIPATAFNRLYGPGNGFSVFGRPKKESGLTMDAALDATRSALRTKFHQKPGEPDRFDFLTPDAIRGFIDQLLAVITVIVVPVTLISLLVGGIVIMNIMLVSVTERTREIGIRKALGATQGNILLQILLESLLMACAGGAIGVGIGAGLTAILAVVVNVTLRVPLAYVLLSVFVSGGVGIVSGWYPASRAAKLDPITALRSE